MQTEQAMQRTARSRGAVGRQAIVPRIVREIISVTGTSAINSVLDFGAGPDRRHVNDLNNSFQNVTAHGYDIGDDWETAMARTYDLVFASNVLNVQPDRATMHRTLAQLWDLQGPHTRLIVNYPKEPRKGGFTVPQIRAMLEDMGWEVRKMPGTGQNTVYELRKQ